MVTLHLGVIDTRYDDTDKATGTGDVAEWLENKYGILGSFAEVHAQAIADDMAKSVKSQITAMMLGGSVSDPFAQASTDIVARMKKYISTQEVERVLGGRGVMRYQVPTKAALDGVRHRAKKKTIGTRRPSFIDTGMYQGSLTAWVDE